MRQKTKNKMNKMIVKLKVIVNNKTNSQLMINSLKNKIKLART